MLVQRWQEIEEYDLGSILGKPELGIKVKKITNRDTIGKFHKYNFDIEHYILDSGKSHAIHNNQYAMITYIISGIASFTSEDLITEAKKGDVVFTGNRELQRINNISNEPLEILCCIDHKN